MPPVSAEDYSATNIQVRGVDEADFVKNDGKYIYLLADGALLIIDAYPAEPARIVSTTPISGAPAEIFLKGDRLDLVHPLWFQVCHVQCLLDV